MPRNHRTTANLQATPHLTPARSFRNDYPAPCKVTSVRPGRQITRHHAQALAHRSPSHWPAAPLKDRKHHRKPTAVPAENSHHKTRPQTSLAKDQNWPIWMLPPSRPPVTAARKYSAI